MYPSGRIGGELCERIDGLWRGRNGRGGVGWFYGEGKRLERKE